MTTRHERVNLTSKIPSLSNYDFHPSSFIFPHTAKLQYQPIYNLPISWVPYIVA